MESLAEARSSIAANAVVLRALETHVEARHAAGDDWGAASWAQIAAEHAVRNHPGRFVFPRLERVLVDLGRALPPLRGPRPGAVARVLHVLTEGYDTGGHTRLAWRWMQRDAGRRHEICLTRPGIPFPPEVAGAAARLHVLAPGSPVARAAELRVLAGRFDCVVLHVHMHDVVPVIAFGGREGADHGPPVVFVDHADHLPWLGAATADVVTACRAPVQDLHATRRGIDAHRSVLLPVPTEPGVRVEARDDARAALGLPAGSELLLTVATAHKMAPAVRPSYPDAVGAALAARPQAVLLIVGAEPADPGVDELVAAFPGRVHAVGRRAGLQPFWDAADVYLDSHPFSSNTSAIEAASHGLPIVSFAPDPAQQGVLLTHDPGFEDLLLRATDPASYAEAVTRALECGDAVAEALRAGAQAAHCGAGWQAHLEEVYARALRSSPAPVPADRPAGEPVADWECIHHALFGATAMAGPLVASVLAQRDVLAPHDAPRDVAALRALARFVAVSRAGTEGQAVRRTVDELRALHAAGVLDRAVVAVAPSDLDLALPLLEDALTTGGDFPLDVVPTDDPGAAATGRVLHLTA